MFRYVFYPLFGVSVLGGYAFMASQSIEVSSTDIYRSQVPPGVATQPGTYAVAPVVWRTGFHGPSAYRPSSYSSGGSGSSYGSGGSYGGSYGGFSGGK